MQKTIPWAHETPNIIPGQHYRVWCAVVWKWTKGNIGSYQYLLPVSPILHKDDKFGVRHKHYHVDGRFQLIEPIDGYAYYQHYSDETKGRNNAGVFFCNPSNRISGESVGILGLMPKILMARYAATGLSISFFAFKNENGGYATWYRAQIGKRITKGRCPHWGALMIPEGGKLRCPLHDLHGCPKTNRIIKHPLDTE